MAGKIVAWLIAVEVGAGEALHAASHKPITNSTMDKANEW
jgi:hypothetical protein